MLYVYMYSVIPVVHSSKCNNITKHIKKMMICFGVVLTRNVVTKYLQAQFRYYMFLDLTKIQNVENSAKIKGTGSYNSHKTRWTLIVSYSVWVCDEGRHCDKLVWLLNANIMQKQKQDTNKQKQQKQTQVKNDGVVTF